MLYHAELQYLQKMLQKMQLQVTFKDSDSHKLQPTDMGLREFGGYKEHGNLFLQDVCLWAKPNTIYKLTDAFLCNYIFFLLPETEKPTSMIIGPYISFPITQQQILENADRFDIPHTMLEGLEKYYYSIPVVSDDNLLFILINSFAETIWGEGGAFTIQDISRAYSTKEFPFAEGLNTITSETSMLNIQVMEQRYAFENKLMQNVSKGLTHRAEKMLDSLSAKSLEQRTPDSVRNVKNFAIIGNTLLRKAAENGGVHPVYLDKASSALARQVENIADADDGLKLMRDMIRTYCRLVQQHSGMHFSALIQKVIIHIESDLTADLSLNTLATQQNVNPSYLSALFHRETGKTLIEYITAARMEAAASLLRTTHLQIQIIAQQCGISDTNYFSKLFKKHYGITPKQFRKEMLLHLSPYQ
ncbi:MAG: helix-turn-helix domain-containing protein [Firmicutes bacterium]|nr:helix-turn-helix domain-containing protein [Bacillota bacterium]